MKLHPFTLLCTAGFFAIFSSTISKSPVLPLFAAHLGADPSGVGFIASVSAFTGIVASIPAGMLSDKFGRKKLLMVSLFIFATAPFTYLFAIELWQLAVIRFYHGFATAIFMPVAMAFVSDLFHRERGEKIGWFSTSTLIGRFIAPISGGGLVGAMILNPELAYKIVYLACGIAGLVALIIGFRLPETGKSNNIGMDLKATFASFHQVASNRYILITSMAEASMLFAYGTFEIFLPLYALNIGITAYEIGILLSAQVITLALTKPMMGRFSDRHGRIPQILWGGIIGAVCIGSFSLFKSFLPLLGLSVLFGMSLSIVTSATSAFIADLSKKETHGSAMGILGSIMDIGHATGPLVSGIIATHFGFRKAFLGASMVLLTTVFLFLTVKKRKRR
jgi:MFS transporter, DHA1 family, multidrug resistance protein